LFGVGGSGPAVEEVVWGEEFVVGRSGGEGSEEVGFG